MESQYQIALQLINSLLNENRPGKVTPKQLATLYQHILDLNVGNEVDRKIEAAILQAFQDHAAESASDHAQIMEAVSQADSKAGNAVTTANQALETAQDASQPFKVHTPLYGATVDADECVETGWYDGVSANSPTSSKCSILSICAMPDESVTGAAPALVQFGFAGSLYRRVGTASSGPTGLFWTFGPWSELATTSDLADVKESADSALALAQNPFPVAQQRQGAVQLEIDADSLTSSGFYPGVTANAPAPMVLVVAGNSKLPEGMDAVTQFSFDADTVYTRFGQTVKLPNGNKAWTFNDWISGAAPKSAAIPVFELTDQGLSLADTGGYKFDIDSENLTQNQEIMKSIQDLGYWTGSVYLNETVGNFKYAASVAFYDFGGEMEFLIGFITLNIGGMLLEGLIYLGDSVGNYIEISPVSSIGKGLIRTAQKKVEIYPGAGLEFDNTGKLKIKTYGKYIYPNAYDGLFISTELYKPVSVSKDDVGLGAICYAADFGAYQEVVMDFDCRRSGNNADVFTYCPPQLLFKANTSIAVNIKNWLNSLRMADRDFMVRPLIIRSNYNEVVLYPDCYELASGWMKFKPFYDPLHKTWIRPELNFGTEDPVIIRFFPLSLDLYNFLYCNVQSPNGILLDNGDANSGYISFNSIPYDIICVTATEALLPFIRNAEEFIFRNGNIGSEMTLIRAKVKTRELNADGTGLILCEPFLTTSGNAPFLAVQISPKSDDEGKYIVYAKWYFALGGN